MEPLRLNTGMDVLEPEECLRLLSTEVIGRVGVVVDNRPEIFPVNFVLAGGHIAFLTDQSTKLRAALAGPVVFEVDHTDPDSQTGWSVMIHGSAQVTQDPPDRAALQTGLPRSWREAELSHLVRIVPVKVTGRRISVPSAHRWPAAGSHRPDPVGGS